MSIEASLEIKDKYIAELLAQVDSLKEGQRDDALDAMSLRYDNNRLLMENDELKYVNGILNTRIKNKNKNNPPFSIDDIIKLNINLRKFTIISLDEEELQIEYIVFIDGIQVRRLKMKIKINELKNCKNKEEFLNFITEAINKNLAGRTEVKTKREF